MATGTTAEPADGTHGGGRQGGGGAGRPRGTAGARGVHAAHGTDGAGGTGEAAGDDGGPHSRGARTAGAKTAGAKTATDRRHEAGRTGRATPRTGTNGRTPAVGNDRRVSGGPTVIPAAAVAPVEPASLLAGYGGGPGDEVIGADGSATPAYRPLLRALEKAGSAAVRERERDRDRAQRDGGVTFRVSGEDTPRIFPVDLVPRIVPAEDWRTLSAGLVQRVSALDAFLRDVYSRRRALHDGVLPAWVVDRSPGLRDTGRAVPPEAVRTVVAGLDLVRDEAGWHVLEDNLRVPSGLGYAVQNRRLSDEVLADLPRPAALLGVENAPALLRTALAAAAPPRMPAGEEPAIVLLNDGPLNSAAFEHQLLADEMGVRVVETTDLAVVDGQAVVCDKDADDAGRARHSRVDVIYLRLDEDDLGRLPGADGRPIGPRLLRAVRHGSLSLANPPGNGVADDKAVYAYVPKLIEYYLGERPLLADVPTYLCGDPAERERVLDRLPELVLKPIDGYGGTGVLIGPQASPAELERARRRLLDEPRRWIAQETVVLSTHPTFDGSRLTPRHIDLRAFVCAAGRPQVASAALTRVAPAGSMIVNSSRGGGAKDTWLLSS